LRVENGEWRGIEGNEENEQTSLQPFFTSIVETKNFLILENGPLQFKERVSCYYSVKIENGEKV